MLLAVCLLTVCFLAGGCSRGPELIGAGDENGAAAEAEPAGAGDENGAAAEAELSDTEDENGAAVKAEPAATGDENGTSRAPGDRLRVAATIFPYYDFVRQIAGDLVELKLVVPAGMDSHSFEPTPADMRAIQESDVLIMNGGAMEQWVSRVLEAVDAPDLTVVTMMDHADVYQEETVEGMEDGDHKPGEPEDRDHEPGEPEVGGQGIEGYGPGHSDGDPGGDSAIGEPGRDGAAGSGDAEFPANGGRQTWETDSDRMHDFDHDGHEIEIEYDEHIWTSPVNAMEFVRVIADTLSRRDPANAEAYAAGAERYLEELQSIHEGFLAVSEARKRNMIVVGDKFPFRYLAEEYGLAYRAAFSGCSTDTEPSARTIAYLIDKVREGQLPAVYYLELSSHRVAEIIGEETGAQPLLLHSCHNVTRAELNAGVTYADLMRGNIESLRKGLDE